jgi:hypothetical protein
MDIHMLPKTLLGPILDNEALTRGLGDAEARMLVEWLVEEAEQLMQIGSAPANPKGVTHAAVAAAQEAAIIGEVQRLCRWARSIARFVNLWCYEQAHGSAIQLAASQRFDWPLPTSWIDPCELMERILAAQPCV